MVSCAQRSPIELHNPVVWDPEVPAFAGWIVITLLSE